MPPDTIPFGRCLRSVYFMSDQNAKLIPIDKEPRAISGCVAIFIAQFSALCRRSKWSQHLTNALFLALQAIAGSSAACMSSAACAQAFC